MCGALPDPDFPVFERLRFKRTKEKQNSRGFEQRENFHIKTENGSFQNVSSFDDEQTQGGFPENPRNRFQSQKRVTFADEQMQEDVSEQTRRMQQSMNPINTPYKPDWKPRQAYTPRKNTFLKMNEFQEEESAFHFRIAKINCNYSPAISQFSVCIIYMIFHNFPSNLFRKQNQMR